MMEARLLDGGRQLHRRIRAVTPHATREHAVEALTGKDGPDNLNITAKVAWKRRIVESNNVRPTLLLTLHRIIVRRASPSSPAGVP